MRCAGACRWVSFNRVEVRDGSVHYRDFDTRPPVDVYLQHVELVAHDLANRPAEGRVAYATARAVPMNAGELEASATFDPFADRPSFDFDGSVTGADLTQWNSFLRAYLHADVEAGHFAIYAELRAESGDSRNAFRSALPSAAQKPASGSATVPEIGMRVATWSFDRSSKTSTAAAGRECR